MTFYDIQKIYIISLPGSPRRSIVREEMGKHNISFEFWDGIKMEDGAKGLKQTFKEIFETSLMKGFNNVLIFEDDCKFLVDMVRSEINWVIEDLPESFDICKLGANLLLPVEKTTASISKIKMSYALHAVLYSRKGMQEILKVILTNDPIDMDIAKKIEPMGNCYVSNKMIATQRPTKSDIFIYDPTKHNKAFSDKYITDDGVIRWDVFMEEQWQKNTKHLN
jgi:hypothetical protein